MPLLLPKTRGIQRQANFSGQPNSSWGTSLTSDGSANVEPATETELIATTSFDTDWVNVWFHSNSSSNTDSDSLVNIKVGTAGSEVSIMPNLLAGWAGTLSFPIVRLYGFPLRIPGGSRISATHRSVRTATTVRCMIELLGGGEHWVGSQVEAVGADTANSTGTYVTPGTGAEGTFTSLGTTGNDWGFVLPMIAGNTDTSMNAGVITGDLGTGVGAAIPGLDDFAFLTSASEFSTNMAGGRYCTVPAGTTLYLSSRFSGVAEAMAWVCYGVY